MPGSVRMETSGEGDEWDGGASVVKLDPGIRVG